MLTADIKTLLGFFPNFHIETITTEENFSIFYRTDARRGFMYVSSMALKSTNNYLHVHTVQFTLISGLYER